MDTYALTELYWKRRDFGLTVDNADVQEGAPTSDQLSSILEYLGPSKAGTVVQDATGATDAMKKFKANDNAFQRPVLVDWMNGRAGMFSRT